MQKKNKKQPKRPITKANKSIVYNHSVLTSTKETKIKILFMQGASFERISKILKIPQTDVFTTIDYFVSSYRTQIIQERKMRIEMVEKELFECIDILHEKKLNAEQYSELNCKIDNLSFIYSTITLW